MSDPLMGPSPGLELACAPDPSDPHPDGGGTESLAAAKVGAVGPLRPIRGHQTKLQDLLQLPKLIRNDFSAQN